VGMDTCPPPDVPGIHPDTGKAYRHCDKYGYCLPCEKDCPVDAIRIDIPY